jgi:hypothetical protein
MRLLPAICLAAAMIAPASAQSLGDLAKQEEARRKAIKKPSKVLTVDSIRATAPTGAPASDPSPAPASTAGKAADAPADKKSKPEDDPKAKEASWRMRMQGARDALQRSEVFAQALQSRINGLTTDVTSRDDPAQRAAAATDRQKSLAELARVKDDMTKQTKAIADIQDEARKAGVPPGWVR